MRDRLILGLAAAVILVCSVWAGFYLWALSPHPQYGNLDFREAQHYEDGDHDVDAIVSYRQGCRDENQPSCDALKQLGLDARSGRVNDIAKLREYFRLSCEGEDPAACCELRCDQPLEPACVKRCDKLDVGHW